ncbi:alpha/beta fold hydrolase [bacterium]|nr:alpha/beta fold hydrolase [bacterium]
MPMLETERMTFHYRTHGAEDGLPMLLLHGSFATSRWWEPFFAILPEDIFAIAPDLRGCGASTHSDGGYAIEDQAADVAAFVDGLGLNDFDLVGHSSGGAIAVEYALNQMARLHSLVLVDTAPVEGVFTPVEGLRLLDSMREDRDLLARALATLMPTAPPSTMTQAEFDAFFAQLVEDASQMAPAAFSAVAHALDRWNRFEEARRLSLPTLLIWGNEDTIIDRDAITRTLIAIPGASNLEVLRGVGHSPMIESPVVLAERIIDFVAEEFEAFEEARKIE